MTNRPLVEHEDFMVLNPPDFFKLTPKRQVRALQAAHRLGAAVHDHLLSAGFSPRCAMQPDRTFFRLALYHGRDFNVEYVWSDSERWDKRQHAADWHEEPRLLAFLVGWRERVASVRAEKATQKRAAQGTAS